MKIYNKTTVCTLDALKKVELLCEENNLSFTDLRKQVFSIIYENKYPIKAYEILNYVKDTKFSAKPPNIYRSIGFLLSIGAIHKVEKLNAYICCSHLFSHQKCFLLICKVCNKIYELVDEEVQSTLSKSLKNNRFFSDNISLEITGTCNNCY